MSPALLTRFPLALALAAALLPSAPAQASNTFGTLSNFDVFNDTEEECHGFEIELEDLNVEDVSYTFGAPYQRYGNPVVEAYAGGVHVRYLSAYNAETQSFVAATPKAPAVITATNGHSCWTGGSGNYLTSGCEHFGVSLRRNPTRTVYRWLVADPQNPGSLKPAGTDVSIPAPIWSVNPPPPDAPDQVHPVVAARIEPPEIHAAEFGEAIWMKVFVTEAPEPAELEHLVSNDDKVPDEAGETEIEWQLLQKEFGKPAEVEQEKQIGEGNESVTRRYEFYKYTGPYDPETHEANVVDDSNPSEGEVGNYIGAQMAAVNLGEFVGSTSTTVPPTTIPTTTSTLAPPTTLPELVCGDANGDGVVTSADALAALRAAVHLASPCAMATCDVDHDGQILAGDALKILRSAVGQPGALACSV